MRYIFKTAQNWLPNMDSLSTTYPHKAVVDLTKIDGQWVNNNQGFPTAEAWLDSIRLQLLLHGATDVLCMSHEIPKSKELNDLRFSFHFKSAADCLQFQAATLANLHGNFVNTMDASTEEMSRNQEKRLKYFLASEDIPYLLLRQNSRVLIVLTRKTQDHLIVGMHIARRTFDSDAMPTTTINEPLHSLEHV